MAALPQHIRDEHRELVAHIRAIANGSRFNRLRTDRVDPRGCRASVHLLDPSAYSACPGRRASLVSHRWKALARIGGNRHDEPGSSGSHSAHGRTGGTSAASVLLPFERVGRASSAACPLRSLCDHKAASCEGGGDLSPHSRGTINGFGNGSPGRSDGENGH